MSGFLKTQSARTIDILLSIVVLFGFIANVWGAIKIDWSVTTELYHCLFLTSSVFLGLTFIYCLTIMYARFLNTIHTVWNKSAKGVIFFFMFVNAIGLIMTLVCFIHVSIDLASTETKTNNFLFEQFMNKQWNYIYYSMCVTILLYLLQFPLWYSNYKRIELRTNGSLEEGEFVIVNNSNF